jgi:probable HAF family extracellular repeat protein
MNHTYLDEPQDNEHQCQSIPRRSPLLRLTINLVASAAIMTACSSSAQGVSYTITDLGANILPSAINNNGQVAGYIQVPATGYDRAFLYSAGVIQNLGTLGGDLSAAYGINNIGQVTGESFKVSGTGDRAFLYSGGTMGSLGTLGGYYSVGTGINDGGQVTGYSPTENGVPHAFLYSGGAMLNLGVLGGTNTYGSSGRANNQPRP